MIRETVVPHLKIRDVATTGSFDWRWPDSVEQFSHGWEAAVEIDGRSRRLRHGVGRRDCFGRERVHTVTWLDGKPTAEGAEAEDFAVSAAVVSVIKRTDRRDARLDQDLDPLYRSLHVVRHDEEIRGPFARRSLAVKLRVDDLHGWALHALLRAGTLAESRATALEQAAGPPRRDRDAVIGALLDFAAEQTRLPTEEASFTPDADANRFVIDDPFAFLVAVLFDQGIVAERAWAAPYELRRRLGHLDPARIVGDPEAVRAAVQGPPALHRYVETVPRWIVSAAARLLRQYDGEAAAIWRGEPTAAELYRRLDEFAGIGQKKAAMAVEILERDLGVPIRELEGSDVAYDVHVRRVFLRTGLADFDELDHILAVARKGHPSRPGAIDNPAWLIGRQWCHAGIPNCPQCAIATVCPKLVDAAAAVRGA